MIFRSEVLTVLGSRVSMLHLRRQRCLMRLVGVSFFLRTGPGLNAAGAPVEGHMVLVDDHRAVIDAGYVGDADIRDRTVIEELASAPFAADKAHAAITKSIVDAAVETDVRSPVPGVPEV